MRENRYRPFNDKKMDRTWVRRGTNQKEEPYMSENVPPIRSMNLLSSEVTPNDQTFLTITWMASDSDVNQ